MNGKHLRIVICVAIINLLISAETMMAFDHGKSDCESCHTLTINEASRLLHKTGGTVKSIKSSPIKGMYEILIDKDGKSGVIYIDYRKKYFMQGMIVDFDNLNTVTAHGLELPPFKQPTFLDVRNIPLNNAIIIGNPNGNKRIFVFTEPECFYCRKIHVELQKLTSLVPELSVHILLYPLPTHPDAYDKSRAILTFKKQSILDKAFAGDVIPSVGTKDAIIELNEIVNFARRNGVTAVPTIVLSNGTVLVGFKTAEELKTILDKN